MQNAPNAARIDDVPTPEAEVRPDPQARAAELLTEIAADAATRPESYLRETVVPEGGE